MGNRLCFIEHFIGAVAHIENHEYIPTPGPWPTA